MTNLFQRDAVARARFFLDRARECRVAERDGFEAHLEAAIVFARAAIHRFKSEFAGHPEWSAWWNGLADDESVQFFRDHRDHILKEGSARVNQVAYIGPAPTPETADGYYYFERGVPATETIQHHLTRLEQILTKARVQFTV